MEEKKGGEGRRLREEERRGEPRSGERKGEERREVKSG